MDGGVLQREARAEKSCLEEQQNQILDALVVLVLLCTLAQVVNDGVVGVDLKVLLGRHVAWTRK